MEKIILSGDVGGTNTRLMLASINTSSKKQALKEICKKKYKNKVFIKFEDIISDFIKESDTHIDNIDAACLAIAGPIINQKVKLTNLPWSISATNLKKTTLIDNFLLINDFTAIGYGIPYLSIKDQRDVLTLKNPTKQEKAPIAYLGAGTGLGVGIMVPDETTPNKKNHCLARTLVNSTLA